MYKSKLEKFNIKLKEKHNDKIILIGEYINGDTNVEMLCNVCGNIWKPKPRKILEGSGCPNCFIIKRTKTNEKFIKEVKDICGERYTILSEYKNAIEKILLKCNICNNNWYVKPDHIINSKSNCPICNYILQSNTQKKSQEQFIKNVFEKYDNKYIVIGEYKNAKTKIEIKCNICDNNWFVKPNSLLSGSECPNCKIRKGEYLIEEYLKNKSIVYKKQYKFNDCCYKYSLFFDFAIFDNNKLLCLVEFDGIQHFEPIEHFGGIEKFKINKIRDEIKNSYCFNNNIVLIRISYLKLKNINKELDIELNKYF